MSLHFIAQRPRHAAFPAFVHRVAAWLRAALRRSAPDLRPLDQRVRESGEW